MAGKLGRSGGSNRTFTAPPAAEAGRDPGSWPWDRKGARWDFRKIRAYVIKWMVERGLVTHERERDLAASVATSLYLKHAAQVAIDECEPGDVPYLGRRDAFVALHNAETSLRQAWSAIGVKPGLKASGPNDDGEYDEFMAQFAEPIDESAPAKH